LSEVIGSWKIIASWSPRRSRIRSGFAFKRSSPVEQDLAGGNPAGRLRHEAHDRQRGDALAASGFADDAERAAALDAQIDPVHGPHLALLAAERGPQARARQEVRDFACSAMRFSISCRS
jgi:hypothetical protein